MQVSGTYHKRRSIQSPQIQLKGYKRKNLTILNQLQQKHQTNKQKEQNQNNIGYKNKIINTITKGNTEKLDNSLTNNTIENNNTKEEINFMTQESIDRQKRRYNNYSVSSTKEGSSTKEINSNKQINSSKDIKSGKDNKIIKHQQTQSTNIQRQQNKLQNRQQMTSRFTINQFQTQDISLTSLINQAKSVDSNPLINTARLRQQQTGQKTEAFHKIQFNSASKPQQQNNQTNLPYNNNQPNTIQNSTTQNFQQQNQIEQNQQQQRQQNQQQNFDDYQFGGQNSNSNILQSQQSRVKQNKKKLKKHKKTLIPPPKVPSYQFDQLIRQKPQNWRELNKYIPLSQEENRMAKQRLLKQKQSLQLKRQQQQIMNMIHQYHINKNNLNLITQRKIQTNKIMHKIYKQKRLNKQSLSLPQLKNIPKPKQQIIVPDINAVYTQNYIMQNPIAVQQKFKVRNILANNFKPQNKPITQNIRGSLSYSKLGFGSSQPRLLNEQQIKQNQMQNIQKIQRRLRQKGINFDPNSVRKGLLNIRDVPIYKISSKTDNSSNQINQQNKLDLPKKQLPSNGFYKIFPL